MKLKKTLYPLAGTLIILSAGLAGPLEAQQMPEKCTVGDARAALAAGRADALCDCTAITRGFVRYLQHRPDFVDLLDGYQTSCAGLANVLSDLPTASLNDRREIGGSDERDTGGSTRSAVADIAEAPSPAPAPKPTPPPDDDDTPAVDDPDPGDDPVTPGPDPDRDRNRDKDKNGDRDRDKKGDRPDKGERPDKGGRPDKGDWPIRKGTGGNNGHGNDDDGFDSSNPGKGKGKVPDDTDQDGLTPGQSK